MRIGNENLGITNSLRQSTQRIARALERLSSGNRINSPTDGAADFSNSVRLTSDLRGLSQINLGLNQAQGLFQTASAAISTQIDIVQRMRELSVQANNSLLTDSDRVALNNELTALRDEFTRITQTTEYADQTLLNGSLDEIELLTSDDSSFATSISDLKASEVFEQTLGNGGFESRETFTGSDGELIREADIDGDGDIDLIGTNSIYFNDGQGDFDRIEDYNSFADTIDLEVADFDGDGDIDIFRYNEANQDVVVLLNDGSGAFDSTTSFNASNSIGNLYDFELGDFDGDGNIDVIIADDNDNVTTFFFDGNGALESEVQVSGLGQPDGIRVGDFNGDGLDDFALEDGDAGELLLYLSDGDGSYTDIYNDPISSGSDNYILADVNGDGRDELLYGQAQFLGVIESDGGNGISTLGVAAEGGLDLLNLQAGDLDGDGDIDIFATTTTANVYEVFINDGQGNFEAQGLENSTIDLGSFVVADLDNDGLTEVVGTSSKGDFEILQQVTTLENGLADLNLLSLDGARRSTKILDNALNKLIAEQTSIATISSRIESTINSNLLLSESLAEALTSLESADFATETAELVSAQILQQAQIASLSQFNQQSAVILGLLESLRI